MPLLYNWRVRRRVCFWIIVHRTWPCCLSWVACRFFSLHRFSPRPVRRLIYPCLTHHIDAINETDYSQQWERNHDNANRNSNNVIRLHGKSVLDVLWLYLMTQGFCTRYNECLSRQIVCLFIVIYQIRLFKWD